MIEIWWAVMALTVIVVLAALGFFQLYRRLRIERFRNRSLSVKYGKVTEQFLPLVEIYPWNPNNFRFLGSPIDGVQFENDKIIFVEFKSGRSQLSKQQIKIKTLVESGKVMFEVVRIGW